MKKSTKKLKMMARDALRGNYTIPIVANILIAALSMSFSSLTMVLFPADTALSWILSRIFSFAVVVILSLFTAGLTYLYLNISRGLPYSFSNLAYMFSRNPDRVLIVGFVLALINLLTTIPSMLAEYFYLGENTSNGSPEQLLFSLYLTLAAVLLGVFLYMLFTIPLSMSYYLLVDQENLTAKEAILSSLRLMKGNWWKYLKLQLSFIPLYILSVFTCYIALLWIIPYLGMAETFFYRELIGDLHAQDKEKIHFNFQENNDYNSEA